MKLSNKKKIELIKEVIKLQESKWNYNHLKAYRKIKEVIKNGK